MVSGSIHLFLNKTRVAEPQFRFFKEQMKKQQAFLFALKAKKVKVKKRNR